MPISLAQQHQKPLQTPILPAHISHQARNHQASKNINSQVTMKQKPKMLPTIPPQNHSIQQQQQVATIQMEQPQNHGKHSANFQTQVTQSFNQQSFSQPQNIVKQLSQTSQPPNQLPELRNKQPALSALQQSQKIQMGQIQQQTVAAPASRADQQPHNNKVSVRQDSNVSSDSFSQNSSPSYTTKTMETPLLPHHGGSSVTASQKVNNAASKKMLNGEAANGTPHMGNDVSSNGNAALTKSISTPASLQTIVRFHHGSNMSLHHKVRDKEYVVLRLA
jgi:corin